MVKVSFRVNEKGEAFEAIPETDNEKVKAKAAERVVKWKFKPVVYENAPQAMRGVVWIMFFLYD